MAGERRPSYHGLMQFMVVAYDGKDEQAAQRRHDSQRAHRELGYDMIAGRQILFSTALLDDNGDTIGSMRVMEFPSRKELDEWLEYEPYVINEVWKDIEIRPCKMGPAFEWMTLESAKEFRMEPAFRPPAGD